MTALLSSGFVAAVAAATLACTEPADQHAATASEASSGARAETLRRFAGTWDVRGWDRAGHELPGHVLTATPDTAGWTLVFPDRPPIPVRVVDASGDLVVIQTAPYSSLLRPGVQVRVLYVTRMNGDRSTGTLVAQYDVGGAAAVLEGRTEGARRQ